MLAGLPLVGDQLLPTPVGVNRDIRQIPASDLPAPHACGGEPLSHQSGPSSSPAPHACGGEPLMPKILERGLDCSPRLWG